MAGVIFISAACSVLLLGIPNSIEFLVSMLLLPSLYLHFLIQRIFSSLVFLSFFAIASAIMRLFVSACAQKVGWCFRAHVRSEEVGSARSASKSCDLTLLIRIPAFHIFFTAATLL